MTEMGPVVDIREDQVIKDDRPFLVTDRYGTLPEGNTAALGLYHRDTRFLSGLDLVVEGLEPVLLHSSTERNYSQIVEMTYPFEAIDREGVHRKENVSVQRFRVLADGSLHERIRVRNFGTKSRRIRMIVDFDADFRDIFEIRGLVRDRRGQLQPPRVDRSTVVLAYRGLDGDVRSTTIRFSPAPERLDASRAEFEVACEPGQDEEVMVEIVPEVGGTGAPRVTLQQAEDRLAREYARWRKRCTRFRSSNVPLSQFLDRAILDLRMLTSHDDGGAEYLDAGVPWYSALFGRDALLTAYQAVGVNPDLAWGALRGLAALQGKETDDWREEEPGKILHEARIGEHGDLDGDGYVEYRRRSPGGLDNQGWKDSGDAIVHPDGRLAEPPIALVEVQGYVYRAKRTAARLAQDLGERELAERLEREAADLRVRFNRDFWLDKQGVYALALDGDKRPVETITSNPGHCLWSHILDEDKAARVTRRLLSPALSSGWGIRTLAAKQAPYDPIGYHTGTVWPHDNALIAHGMRGYGFDREARTVLDGLAAAGAFFPYARFPELFCGFSSEEVPVPVQYPVACRPQAWASGAPLLMVRTYGGLSADAPQGVLYIDRPRLPAWLHRMEILGMNVGDTRLALVGQWVRQVLLE